MDDLVRSIKVRGLLQPIIVRAKGGHYQIVTGNRRHHTCTTLGWRKIVYHVVELNDKEAFEVSLIENIYMQRKNIQPMEELYAFKNYVLKLDRSGGYLN